MRLLPLPLLVLTLGWVSCQTPPVFSGADKRQNVQAGRIEGHLIVNSVARGKVVLFLYDAQRPPPPQGVGRPLSFTVVGREKIFGNAPDGDGGPFTAPFAFSLVAPGHYLIRGFIDADDDFIPWYSSTADTTRGDVGGAAIDPLTRAPRIIEVGLDEAEHPVPALDVPVSFSDSARIPVDRPIFSVSGGQASITLAAQPKVVDLLSQPMDTGVVTQPAPVFLLRFVDDDGDGKPDDKNGDGIAEIWPRVVVRKLAEGQSQLTDENDLDHNGIIDETGEDYAHVGAEPDGTPDLVVLAAGFDISEYAALLFDDQGRVKTTPVPVTHLKLVVQPRAFDLSAPQSPQPLASVPAGRYAITVIQLTGQTWRLPNELGQEVRGLPWVPSQNFVLEVK